MGKPILLESEETNQIKFLQSINAFNRTEDISLQNKTILNLLNLTPGESILDVGCGIGSLCKMMADIVGHAGNVNGVDISQLIISLAEENNPYHWLTFRKGDAMNLDIQDSTIDALSCIQVAEYLPNVSSFLSTVYRILKNNSRAVIVTTDWKSLAWSHWRKDYSPKWQSHCYDPILHTTLQKKLIQVGFKTVYCEKYNIKNFDYTPLSYSYWLSSVILEYMIMKNYFSKENGNKWITMLVNSSKLGKYHFNLTRYMFLAKK